MLEEYWIGISDNQNRGQYDVAQDLWWAIQQSWEYIHDEYTLKYHYFEGNFEYDDMEEICEKGLFSTKSQWDMNIPYDIWKSNKWFYVYFLVPSKYEENFWWTLSSRFKSWSFPANINNEVSSIVEEIIL